METKEKTKTEVVQGAIKYISQMNEGDIISHEEFRQLIGIETPNIANYKSTEAFVNDLKNSELKYLSYRDEVRDKLLKQKKRTFINVASKGYVILTPSEQVNEGTRALKDGTKKALKKAVNLYKYTPKNRISLKEKQQINDNIAKAGSINAIINTIKP